MFLKKLFDINFETFVTRDVAKVLYVVVIALIAIIFVLAEVAGFLSVLSQDGGLQGIFLIVLAPIVSLILLTIIRVGFESSIALVSIAENTKK